MFSKKNSSHGFAFGLVALLMVVSEPSLANAESLVLRNDTPTAVVTQVSSVSDGQVRRERPYLLNPKATTPAIHLPGIKVITIYDARIPTRALYQGTIQPGSRNQLWSIIPDTVPPRVRLQQITP